MAIRLALAEIGVARRSCSEVKVTVRLARTRVMPRRADSASRSWMNWPVLLEEAAKTSSDFYV
ncbi:MAG: hypothetical protein ACRC1G_09400 [Bradyrhizobium sp.]